MANIRVLPDILASQVAAGEVVERPASVVKELVENSIDAGAREIRVDIDRGGAALIRVSDDGCGMSREDALMSLERHATSKLRTSGDLAAILTLGFRGEAVPSIASVSRFRMMTRETSSVSGTEIVVEGGKIRDVKDAGGAPGTVIEAKSLFFNMPARKKFMRAESTESAHVEHQLRLHALAAPQVRFRFRKDDREIFDLPPAVKSVDRVRQIVGGELARELIEIPLTHGNGVSVEGHALPATYARKGRRHQFVFLNGRPVEDSVISRALAEGFKGSLSEGLHPAAWLWIELEPSLVDVNVHPAKKEVRFHRPLDIREVILSAVLAALKPAKAPSQLVAQLRAQLPDRAVDVVVPSFHVQQPTLAEWSHTPAPTRVSAPVVDSQPAEIETILPPESAPMGMPDFRILGMLHHRFVLLESEDGLVLFDPKAARERIFFEKLTVENSVLETQGLLVPVLIELDPRDLDLMIRERLALLEAGIEVEAFGGNTLQIRALPACLHVEQPQAFVGELLDEILHGAAPSSRFSIERMAKLLAKKASQQVAPKLGETERLLKELFECELPYCAADGRPTLTEYGMREIEKRFGLGK